MTSGLPKIHLKNAIKKSDFVKMVKVPVYLCKVWIIAGKHSVTAEITQANNGNLIP